MPMHEGVLSSATPSFQTHCLTFAVPTSLWFIVLIMKHPILNIRLER